MELEARLQADPTGSSGVLTTPQPIRCTARKRETRWQPDPTGSSRSIEGSFHPSFAPPASSRHAGKRIPRDPPGVLRAPSTHPSHRQKARDTLASGLYNPPVDLTCPACTAPELTADVEGSFDCTYCGTHFVTERLICPACGELNDQGADLCSNCGEPLSIVASVIDRQGGSSRPLWIRRLQTQIADLKESEASASADRFEEFVEIDQRRLRAEAEAHARQQQKDRSILFYGAAAILLILFIVMVLIAIL